MLDRGYLVHIRTFHFYYRHVIPVRVLFLFSPLSTSLVVPIVCMRFGPFCSLNSKYLRAPLLCIFTYFRLTFSVRCAYVCLNSENTFPRHSILVVLLLLFRTTLFAEWNIAGIFYGLDHPHIRTEPHAYVFQFPCTQSAFRMKYNAIDNLTKKGEM